MSDLVERLRTNKLPSVSHDGNKTSQIDFLKIIAERQEAAAIIETQDALIARLQDALIERSEPMRRAGGMSA